MQFSSYVIEGFSLKSLSETFKDLLKQDVQRGINYQYTALFVKDCDFRILCWKIHSGQFRDQKSLDLHEKSLDQSNYEIFPHKIIKSRTFKKSSILIVSMSARLM